MSLNEELVEAAAKAGHVVARHRFAQSEWSELSEDGRQNVLLGVRAAIDHYLANRSLPDRMREASATLREANQQANRQGQAGYRKPELFEAEGKWNAVKLEHWADRWAAEDRDQAEQDALVDEIAQTTLDAVFDRQVNLSDSAAAAIHRSLARGLIAKFDIKPRVVS